MPGMLMDYTYTSAKGDSYKGQVVADPTIAKYNYTPGATYAMNGGVYSLASTPGTQTTAPSGSVYQTEYTSGGKTYDSYHYDPKYDSYYDVKAAGYDKTTGKYTPPGAEAIPMWSTKQGLGSEYAYIKTADNTYHVYGGGGAVAAKITPDNVGLTAYDYKFAYPDGSYYLGKVVDDGSYGYKVGQTIPKAGGSYSIYGVDPQKPAATALAGQTYTQLYHDASGTNYAPAAVVPTSPYYNKPTGYGGVGSESDYIHKPGGYYQFSAQTSADKATALMTLPLPT